MVDVLSNAGRPTNSAASLPEVSSHCSASSNKSFWTEAWLLEGSRFEMQTGPET